MRLRRIQLVFRSDDPVDVGAVRAKGQGRGGKAKKNVCAITVGRRYTFHEGAERLEEELINMERSAQQAGSRHNRSASIRVEKGHVALTVVQWRPCYPRRFAETTQSLKIKRQVPRTTPLMERRLSMRDNGITGARFRVAKVSGPLKSVADRLDREQRVVFERCKFGNNVKMLVHKATGKTVPIQERNQAFEIEIKLKRPLLPGETRACKTATTVTAHITAAEEAGVKSRTPNEPSEREVLEHGDLHEPHRAWCPACVAGRGLSDRQVISDSSAEA